MILLIDNYDSFSYNLYQLIGSIKPDIVVIRNDEKTVGQIEDMKPEAIIISPGPGRPENAGVCVELIKKASKSIPIFGVCLGHQAICKAFGAEVSYAKTLMHGKQSLCRLDTGCPIFKNLPKTIPAARYHSLSAVESTMPDCLEVTARADDGEIMAVKHRNFEVYGVQFHPESIMTPDGKTILQNFIDRACTKKEETK